MTADAAPAGVDAAAWQRGIDRAREALAAAPSGRQCAGHKRCKQPVTDISGLCARHIAKARQR